MNSSQENTNQETPQETNEKATTADENIQSPESQENQVENFYSDSGEEDVSKNNKYDKILSHRINSDGSTSYLVKYPHLSYHHLEWVLESIIQKHSGGNELIEFYRLFYPEDCDPPEHPFDPKYLDIEKIITSRQENNGSKSYLTKWCGLDYQNLTWEPESSIPQNIINEFHKMNQIPDFKEQFIKRKIDYTTWSPFIVSNFIPKKHQIEGLKYITHSFCNEQNVILGDEPGLGSSIQCSMFLKWLTSNETNQGPFLIIATEERIQDWKESLEKLQIGPVLTFLRPKIQRDTIAEYELFYPGTTLAKMNLILSNFSIQVHNKVLSEINWQSIFIDISHFKDNEEMEKCLTNDFFNLLSKFESYFTLLITQVPITDFNLLKNCFSLLFKNLAKVTLDYTKNLDEQTQTIIYKSSLRSILLKRTLEDIKNINHPITEYIINCGLTEIQLDLIQCIYQKYISYIITKSNGSLIKSIFQSMKLICTHPYTHKGAEENILISKKFSDLGNEINQTPAEFHKKALIESSSKMKFLQQIVNYIKDDKKKNDRLIICSHNEDILDIVQEYFEYENIFFERIDSNIRGEERNRIIEKYNMVCSIDFSFLIHLDAGLKGIKLRNVSNAVLIDSGLSPQKDIETIINLIDSNEINIYRLLCSRTIERLLYDKALLRSSCQYADKLNANGEIVSLLGFGIDLHDSIDYQKDSIEEILDRSTRNYYENSFEFDSNDSNSSVFRINNENKIDLWKNITPYLIKEDFSFEKQPNTRFSQLSTVFWTVGKIIILIEGLVRFGWGRWASIYNNYNDTLEGATDFEINAICHIFVHVLLESTKNSFPIATLLYQQQLSPQAAKYEEKFIKEQKDFNTDLFIKNCDEKLFRIEFMYFINVVVATCPNPPEEIAIPYLDSFISDSWNEDADRHLIYHIYKNGFMQFGNTPINAQFLEYRSKQLIEVLKDRYLLFREMKNPNAQFEHFTLVRSLNMLTREEQRRLVQFMIYYGWTTAEDFKTITNSYRTPKELNVIHKVITNFCKGQKEMINDLAESIPSSIANLLLTREKLLFQVRNNLKKEDVLKPDWPIVEYVIKNGFIDLESCDEIRSKFGTNSTTIEYKVSNFLLKYLHNSNINLYDSRDLTFNLQKGQIARHDEANDQERHHNPSPHLKRQSNSQINVEYNKEGQPVMPIQITPSLIIVNLGEIVTDRPNFYNGRYIYPKNFESLKMYKSTINPNDRAWYKSSIIDDGTDSPLFRVEMKDDPSVFFEGRAPSKPWLEVLKVINDRKKEIGLQMSKIVTVSGPEYFGLAAPIVQSLIQKMKGAEICLNFINDRETISAASSSGNINIIHNQSSLSEIPIANEVVEANQTSKNEDENENNADDENDSQKITLRKRTKHINYAESSSTSSKSSSSSSSESEELNGNDKDFNAPENNDDDDDDENELFDEDEDEDIDNEHAAEEDDVVGQKKGSSRNLRTRSNNISTVNRNVSYSNYNSGVGSGNAADETEERCLIA